MTDKYKIDSHKLIYHPDRVNKWLKDPLNTYPIYVEIGVSGQCNHRCKFCGYDYVGYKQVFSDTGVLIKRLKEMGKLGVRSVLYSGEGEPLLHKDIAEIIVQTKKAGIDVALVSNGALLNEKFLKKTLGSLTWLKISIDSGTNETHCKIHRGGPKDFDKIIQNLADAVKIRKKNNYKCTIGGQMLLLPDNYKEAVILAKKLKKIGVDYLVVKPYSQHPLSKTKVYKNVRYQDYFYLNSELQKIADEKFKVIFRAQTMKKWDSVDKPYKKCCSVPFFWAHIDAGGEVWGCGCFVKDRRFYLGNIYKNSFKEIWQGRTRKDIIKFMEKFNVSRCRINCRMDEINKYLWNLKNPSGHVNFI